MRLVMLLPCLVASLALVPHAPHLAPHLGARTAPRHCAGPLACETAPPPPEAAELVQESAVRWPRLAVVSRMQAEADSLFPAWPELSTKADVADLIAAFGATAAAVPLSASNNPYPNPNLDPNPNPNPNHYPNPNPNQVPLSASSEEGEGWRRWRDEGFDTHKLMAARLSRQSYPEAAACLRSVLATTKKSYPDLYATLGPHP